MLHKTDRVKVIHTHGKNNGKEGVISKFFGNTCEVLLDNGERIIIPDINYQLEKVKRNDEQL